LEGYGGLGLLLLAVEVEVLDLLRLGLVAVLAGEVVVEVLLARAHAADVEGGHGAGEVEEVLHVISDRDQAAGCDLERTEVGIALGLPCRESITPDLGGSFWVVHERQPAVGVLRGTLDRLGSESRDVDRDTAALGAGQHLQRLAEARALAFGQWQAEDRAGVLDPLAAQGRTNDLDGLLGTSEGLAV